MVEDDPCPCCEAAWRMRADRARRRSAWLRQTRRIEPREVGWDDLTAEQQEIVEASKQPGVILPDTVRTADQFREWMQQRRDAAQQPARRTDLAAMTDPELQRLSDQIDGEVSTGAWTDATDWTPDQLHAYLMSRVRPRDAGG